MPNSILRRKVKVISNINGLEWATLYEYVQFVGYGLVQLVIK